MLAGVKGNVRPGLSAQLMGPHAGAGHHVFGLDCPLVGFHPDRATVLSQDPFDRDTLDDRGAPFPGHCGKGHCRFDRRGLRIPRDPDASQYPCGVHEWPSLNELADVHNVYLDSEAPGHSGTADQFLHSAGVVCEAHGSDRSVSGGMAHFVFEPVVEVCCVGGEPGHVVGCP